VITLPGGYGSMDEHFEALTLAQLRLYHKPIGLLNVRGYYDGALLEGQNIWNQSPEIVRAERLGAKFEPAPSGTKVLLSGDIDRVAWASATCSVPAASSAATWGPAADTPITS
jgi:hypothetical protein